MANYVFKQFCRELDDESLENLIKIVAMPNDRQTEMIEAVDDEDASYGSDEEADPDSQEVSDDSDDIE